MDSEKYSIVDENSIQPFSIFQEPSFNFSIAPNFRRRSIEPLEEKEIQLHYNDELEGATNLSKRKGPTPPLQVNQEKKNLDNSFEMIHDFCSAEEDDFEYDEETLNNTAPIDYLWEIGISSAMQTLKKDTRPREKLFDFFKKITKKNNKPKRRFQCPYCPADSPQYFSSGKALGGHQGRIHHKGSGNYTRRKKTKKENTLSRERRAFLKKASALD